jgi:alpha-glucoside transport system permease protein
MSTQAETAPAGVRGRFRRRARAGAEAPPGILVWLGLGLICFLWIVPALGLLVTSVRDADDASSSGWWTALFNPFEEAWTFENYTDVLNQGMDTAFLNSLIVTIPATVIPIMIACFAAYAFSFMHFRGRDPLFILCVALLVVPVQIAFIPLLRLFSDFDLNGKFAAVWLVHAGFGMPLAIYTIRNYMATLPHEVIESAKVDGASHFTTFWRLIVPMSIPVIAAYAILQFLWVWNDLLVALVFLGAGDNQVVTQKLAGLVGQFGQDWHLLTSGAFISMALPLAIFFALQRFFVRGLTAGAVKG